MYQRMLAMELAVHQRKQLMEYINSGSVTALQRYFNDATAGFAQLVRIANGEPRVSVDKKGSEIREYPSFNEQIQAAKLMMDKSIPSLKASHVTQHHVSHKLEDVDACGLVDELNELTAVAEAMKRKESA